MAGFFHKSIEFLRIKGIAKASKKMSRTASEGLALVKEEKGEISIIEINSETDFVAKNEDFINFVKELSDINNQNDSNINKLQKVKMKKVALLGMPNTGKSTLFNQISGSSAKVGNWPGITVDLYSVKTLLNGHLTELIDLPGIYDLKGYSEDEKVVHTFLANNKIDQVLFIINSTQIDRQLGLALNIIKLGNPVVIIANMMDEAKKFGITFNFDLLESFVPSCEYLESWLR